MYKNNTNDTEHIHVYINNVKYMQHKMLKRYYNSVMPKIVQ